MTKYGNLVKWHNLQVPAETLFLDYYYVRGGGLYFGDGIMTHQESTKTSKVLVVTIIF